LARKPRRNELAEPHQLDGRGDEGAIDRHLAELPVAGRRVRVDPAETQAAVRPRLRSKQETGGRVPNREARRLRVEVLYALDVVAEEPARELGGDDQSSPVVLTEREVGDGHLQR